MTASHLSVVSDDDNDRLPGYIRELFQRARAHRRGKVAEWNRNYRILRNRTWLEGRATWLPSPEVPEVLPIISTMVGWMTDQRPTYNITPWAPPHSQFANFYSTVSQDLQTAMYAAWQMHDYDAHIELSVFDAYVYGTGILKTGWDASLNGGLGDAVLRRVDPYTFYPDPNATSMEDANYFIEARTMSLQEMDRRWPGAAKKFHEGGITEDVDAPPNLDTHTTAPKANPAAISGGSPRYGLPGQSRINATDDPGVTVFEAWLRQHSTHENEDGTLAVFDAWRVVVVAGNTVLMDEDAEDLWEHASHPYQRVVLMETGEFWGMAMVDFLRSCQLSINRLLASLIHNIELVGNPVFKESTRAGIMRTKITNRPGTRVSVNENSTAEWLNPPQTHPLMMQLVTFFIGEMERISGMSAVVRGATPTGRNAEGVIDAVQEAAFVRIRLALRNLERALRSAGNKIASLIVENYTGPRMVAITGPNGEKTMLSLKARHFHVPTTDGHAPLRFTLNVEAGSSLPTSRKARAAEADTLYAMGAIDRVAVLEAHEYPNRDEIARRVNALEAAGVHAPPGARQRAQRTS